ncbi:MFS transporter [Actinomycetaceae bacterium L2_0104]
MSPLPTRTPPSPPRHTAATRFPATSPAIALLVTTALFVLMQLYAAIPLASAISAEFEADATFALSTMFSLCYAAGFLLWGPISDHVGRKKVLITGMLGLVATTIGCAFASSLPLLGVWRGLQGLTAASYAPVALAYLSEAVRPRLRPTAIGAMSTAFLVAGIAGQVGAQALALSAGWPSVFLVSAALLALCLLAIAFVVVEPGPSHPATPSGLGQRFAETARLITKLPMALLAFAHLTLLLSFTAMYTALGPHLGDLGLEPSDVIWLRLIGLPGMFASLFVGPVSRRISMPGVAIAGFGLAAAGLALESLLAGSVAGIALASLVFVTGVALAVPSMITLFGETAAPHRAGGMALNGFFLFLGASIGPLTAALRLDFSVLMIALACLLSLAVVSMAFFRRLGRVPAPQRNEGESH